jgi:two-component system response regulator AlgR
MSVRIFIVDDEAPARARLRILLSDIAGTCSHEVVGEADRPQAALDGITALRPDLVLLDVQMPGMSGVEVAGRLKQLGADAPSVIFVTAYDAYALQAFDLHAADYLVKPVRAERLAEAIRRAGSLRASYTAAENAALHERRRHFSVQERSRVLLVPVREVLYAKAEQKYVTLHTRERDYLIEDSLVSIEEEFGDVFLRVHRNALVARDAVVGVERAAHPADVESESERSGDTWEVLLRNVEERLPISRRQWQAVKALIK